MKIVGPPFTLKGVRRPQVDKDSAAAKHTLQSLDRITWMD